MTIDKKPRILLIYTGGTIGMRPDSASGALVPFDFTDIYQEFPNLRYLEVDIEVMSLEPIDSSNVTPELWVRLATIIGREYQLYDGFVVLHGTDTMSYSASALSFMLENLAKPVIFTGSQIPIGVMRTDGRENLITAIEIAGARTNGRPAVPEVGLYFQNKLFRGNRTTKYSAEELNAFRSANFPPLAHVGVNIHYNYSFIRSPRTDDLPPLKVHTEVCPDVAVVRIYPGMTEKLLRTILRSEGLKGVVLETYGAGNAPTERWFIDAVEDTVRNGIAVMNVTQCQSGTVAMELYETGIRLRNAGVISGKDITTESAVTKMMCMLGRGLQAPEINAVLESSVAGEVG